MDLLAQAADNMNQAQAQVPAQVEAQAQSQEQAQQRYQEDDLTNRMQENLNLGNDRYEEGGSDEAEPSSYSPYRSNAHHVYAPVYQVNSRMPPLGIPVVQDTSGRNPQMPTLGEMMKIIPTYNGDPRQLSRFIRKCDFVLQQYRNGSDERYSYILEVITSRLIEKAAELVSENDYLAQNWTMLKQLLIQHYGDQRTELLLDPKLTFLKYIVIIKLLLVSIL
ncbi:uncharacterized protein LOC125238595 [Leguminivora glycinivorella]|uniref:uncharacterized protein LOC125238595 n=1 Tax=Leguminivora glycinivorella TaxID=1035111 RepID=UPI00200C45E2|nr:uncharacterized protein LOC125238595 [Leguminivora glycinivorella]